MFNSTRLLNTLLDHVLLLLPAEPAAFKRLDDIGDADPGREEPGREEPGREETELLESGFPQSAVHATTLRAAS